jgi:hypothetical protein
MRRRRYGQTPVVVMYLGAVEFAAGRGSVHGMAGEPRRVIAIGKLARHQTGEPPTPVQKTDLILHDESSLAGFY